MFRDETRGCLFNSMNNRCFNRCFNRCGFRAATALGWTVAVLLSSRILYVFSSFSFVYGTAGAELMTYTTHTSPGGRRQTTALSVLFSGFFLILHMAIEA